MNLSLQSHSPNSRRRMPWTQLVRMHTRPFKDLHRERRRPRLHFVDILASLQIRSDGTTRPRASPENVVALPSTSSTPWEFRRPTPYFVDTISPSSDKITSFSFQWNQEATKEALLKEKGGTRYEHPEQKPRNRSTETKWEM